MILACSLLFAACSKQQSGAEPNSGSGQGGSLARFTVVGDYLYVVDSRVLYTYSIGNGQPVRKTEQSIQGTTTVETIYGYGNYLFIGSSDAMYIYSLANPNSPILNGQASHVRACDPVVANDSIAYVTVRAGNTCGGNQNALMVYDIRNVMNPVLKKTEGLASPYGLGMRDRMLYVCDGSYGLKIYNITKPLYPNLKRTITGLVYKDVIATNDLLICMIDGGMVLYSYDNTGQYLVEQSRLNY
jgi:Uncharacterized conserved protein